MAENGTVAYVAALPKCNFCENEALYDYKTKTGPWAYGCQQHYEWTRLYSKLGLGKGQKLVVKN